VKYNCRNCGSVFEGDDFTLECPKCDSTELDIYSGKTADEKAHPKEKEDKTINISASEGTDSAKTQFIKPSDFKQDDNPTVNIPPASSSRNTDSQKQERPSQNRPEKPAPRVSSAGSERKQAPKKKSNSVVFIVIGLVLILAAGGIWYTTQSDSEKDSKKEVVKSEKEAKVRIDEKDGAFFIKGSIIDGNEEKELQASDILAVYRANDRREVNYNKSTGQVYFCQDMEGLTAFAIDIRDYNGSEAVTNGVELSLFGNPPAPEAKCQHRLESRFIEISFTSSCAMLVKITDPHDYGDEGLEVSISGKNGQFIEGKFKWDVKALSGKTVDVWVRQQGMAAVPYSQNETRVVPNCGNDVDWDAIKAKLAMAAQKYGANPRDRAASQEVQEISMKSLPGNPIFIVDGEELSGFSALSTKFRIDNMNEGKTFELSSQPQIVNKRFWKIEYKSK
jgi:hypothetical protein